MDQSDEETRPRPRSKSPQFPKMPTFSGSGSPTWESFIFQFERQQDVGVGVIEQI